MNSNCSDQSCSQSSCLICDAVVTLFACGVAAGSLYLSLGLGLQACPLCLYQRAFVFSAAAVLVTGLLLRSSLKPGVVAVSALAPAVAGAAAAGFHVSRELAGKMECPAGLFGIGSAPQQALLGQGLLALMLLVRTVRELKPGRLTAGPAAIALGLAAAYGAVAGAPPAPPPVERGDPATKVVCKPIKPAE